VISVTKGTFTHENYAQTAFDIENYYQIFKIVKKDCSMASLGLTRDTVRIKFGEDFAFSCKDWQYSVGDIRPYGAILLGSDFSAIVYSKDMAKTLWDGYSRSNVGFVVQIAPKPFKGEVAARVFPTKHFSNPFSRLYGMIPTGVLALDDMVIASYDGEPVYKCVNADHICYSGISLLGAFDVKESYAPCLFLPDSVEYTKADWIATAANALSVNSTVGKVPGVEGFVTSGFPSDEVKALRNEVALFKVPGKHEGIKISKKPTSVSNNRPATIISVVLPQAVTDPELAALVNSGIGSERTLVNWTIAGCVDTWGDFTSGSGYDFLTLADDFAALITRFNEEYLKLRSDVIRLSYDTFVAIANVAKAEVNKSKEEAIATGFKTGVEHWLSQVGTEGAKVSDCEIEVPLEGLGGFKISWPSCFNFIASTDDERLSVVLQNLPFFVSARHKREFATLSSGTSKQQEEIATVIRKSITDFITGNTDRILYKGSEFFGGETLAKDVRDVLEQTAQSLGAADRLEFLGRWKTMKANPGSILDIINRTKEVKDDWYWEFTPFPETCYRRHRVANSFDPFSVVIRKSSVNVVPETSEVFWKVEIDCAFFENVNADLSQNEAFDLVKGVWLSMLPTEWTVVVQGWGGYSKGSWVAAPDNWFGASAYKPCRSVSVEIIIPLGKVGVLNLDNPESGVTPSEAAAMAGCFKSAMESAVCAVAFEVIRPLLESMKVVAEQTAFGRVGTCLCPINVASRVAMISDEYINSILTAIKLAQEVLTPEIGQKLQAFSDTLEAYLASSKLPQLYLLTEALCLAAERYHDAAALPLSLVYGGSFLT